MSENTKNSKGMFIGGIAAAVAAVIACIVRVALNAEIDGIKSSHASIVQVGAKKMSRSEYIDFASGIVNGFTAAAVILLIAAAVLIGMYMMKNKKIQTEN